MKSILLVGQSNMAGRGYLDAVPTVYNENAFMLRNGRWQLMTEPIHFDRSVAGIGPAGAFAALWCHDHPGEQIVSFRAPREGAPSTSGRPRERSSATR